MRLVSRFIGPCLALLWLAAFAPTVQAYVYLFENYTEREGLLNNQVNAVAQDTEGTMWFATRGGITRYDGQEWVAYGFDEGIQEKEFSHLTRGPQGKMWAVSTRVPFRVQYFENGRWESLEAPPIPRINGQTFLFEVGLSKEGELLICLASQESPLCFYTRGRWIFLVDERLTSLVHSFALVDGQLYIATPEGLFRIDPLEGLVFDDPLPGIPEGQIFVLENDPVRDQFWLVGRDWIGTWQKGIFDLVADGLDLASGQTWSRTSSLVDREGGLYFGGISRVYRFDPRLGLEELDREAGRLTSGGTDFFQDREGNLWITSLRGVDRLISRRFAGLDRSQGLLLDEVTAVLETGPGQIVLGHERGLTFLGEEFEPFPFDIPTAQLCRVMGMVEDGKSNVWVGTDGSGLLKLGQDGSRRWFGEAEGLIKRVFSVHVDESDRIWAGTFQGLFVGDADGFKQLELPEQDREDPPFVRKVFQASDGSLYLATGRDGVIRYHQGHIHRWKGQDIAEGNSTYAIIETNDHRIWAGSSVGLFTLVGDSLVATRPPDPVLDRPVYAMARDSRGRVWFGTDSGVFIWDGDQMAHYSVEQGLIGSEINRAGLLEDSQGQFWVGTDRGVSVYRPWLDLPPGEPPTLKILAYEADGRAYPADSQLRLGTPPRTFHVQFIGLSFVDERHMRFRTWLHPFEESWAPASAGPISEVRYTNLPPGTYTFRVQLVNSDGSSSEVVHSPPIIIKPPLLRRWWVLLGLLLIVTGAGYGVVSTWEAQRYRRRLESEVRERTADLAESERAVRVESQRLLATLGSILDGVLALDEKNRVVLCNPAAEAILDRSAADIVGRDFQEVMPLQRGRGVMLEDGQLEFNCQDRLECPRRGTVCLELSSAAITDSGGQRTGSVVAFSDITDRLRMERELLRSQKLESLGLLAGGIAHDFNNLLTIMLGNMDLVENAPGLESIDRESLQLAKQASTRARSLTDQLLTFARGGAPVRMLQSLDGILEQSVALSFSGMAVHCQLDLPDDLWLVDVDAGQMSQVFNNLLINAVQAMSEGGKVHVRGRNLTNSPHGEGSGEWVRIDIRDEGPGIPEKILVRIFDPYFTTKSAGSGLGLATAHSIVTRHGGLLRVESLVGSGSTFSVFLPRGQGQVLEFSSQDFAVDLPAGRILVLEDESGIQNLMKRYLGQLGMEVVVTSDGTDTVARFAQALDLGEPFDLVLTDLTIPGGQGGRSTLAELKERDPEVKAIVISGYSHEDVLANYRDFGFQGALAKPFTLEQLGAVLARVLGPGDPA